jgi:hypothetical protein
LPIGYRRDAFLLDAWVVGLWSGPSSDTLSPVHF